MFGKNRIVLHTTDAIFIVDIKDILYCKSNNNSTTFYMANLETIVVSGKINDYENQLAECGFIRPHQSYLVNLAHMRRIDKTNGFTITLTGNNQIPTSTRKKKEILQILQNELRFQTKPRLIQV